jgi:integrase
VLTGKLTALKVKSLVAPGRYGDGGGLWLQVRDGAHRSWLYRYTVAGKQRQMGLGSVGTVTLADARLAVAECRRLLQQGTDPIDSRAQRKAAQRSAVQPKTFREVAELYVKANESSWRNPKHRWQWEASLSKYVHPSMGDRAVADIATGHVMAVLEPIWRTVPETASRIRGRIETVLDYAKARDWRSGENPARWRGHIANMLPGRNKARSVVHHPALPWQEAGAFMVKLRVEDGVAAMALQFTILTAARTGEVIGATWGEIDLQKAVWIVPGARMKAGREHRVPLSPAALTLLTTAAALRTDPSPDAYVFPASRPEKPLSAMAMSMLLRRMDRANLTVHGFRSSFRDWAAEATGVAREVAEAALAHSLADRVEAAYRRSDLFEKRRRLMDDWAAYCERGEGSADVVPFRIQFG